MHQDAQIIVKVACHMFAKYGEGAARLARQRAKALITEPRASARWRAIGDTIDALYYDGFEPIN